MFKILPKHLLLRLTLAASIFLSFSVSTPPRIAGPIEKSSTLPLPVVSCSPKSPFSVAGAVQSGENQKFLVTSQTANLKAVAFNPDGTKMFILGLADPTIFEYSLGTAYDLSTVSYSGDLEKLSITATSNPSSITFNNNGTKLYISDSRVGNIHEYSLSTAYDVSTATYNGFGERLSFGSVDTTPWSIIFKPDGTKLFIVGGDSKKIFTVNLSTPFDVSTGVNAGASGEFSYSSQSTSISYMQFNNDGTRMILNEGGKIFQYTLSTAYDVSTANYDGDDKRHINNPTNVSSIFFSGDGSKLFKSYFNVRGVWRYDLTSSDVVAPTMTSASKTSNTQIKMVFSENVASQGISPGNFTVTDGAARTYAVSSIGDAQVGNTELELNVADLSGVLGNLTITYTNNGNEVVDNSCNPMATNAIGVQITLDSTLPTLVSGRKVSNTQIALVFNEPVKTKGTNPTDFKVKDAGNVSYTVSAQVDGTAADNEILLTVADFSTSTGNLTVTYTNNNNEISDFGGNSLSTNATGVIIEIDRVAPLLISGTKSNNTTITLTFSENVQTNGTNPTDFTVTDGTGSAFVVSAQSDGTINDTNITLTVADLSTAVGDLKVTYANNNSEIRDASGNVLATNANGIVIDIDTNAPTLVSATKDSNTQITLTLNEKVKTNGTNPTDFTVRDGVGTNYVVSTQADGTARDSNIILTVADISSAVGDVTVRYANNNNEVSDFGGNDLATNAVGVIIDLDTQAPTLVSASKIAATFINVIFSESVKTNGGNPTDFKVTDGQGNTFAVSAQADFSTFDAIIVLTVPDLANAQGDLKVTYTNNNGEITDFGGNQVATDATGVIIDDSTPPTSIITRQSPTTVTASGTVVTFMVSFNEAVKNVSNDGSDFAVSGSASATGISVASASASIYNVTVSGISGGGKLNLDFSATHDIADFGNNNFGGTITSEEEYTIDNTAPIGYSVKWNDDLIGLAETSTSKFTFTGAEIGTTYSYTVSSNGGGTNVTSTGTISTSTDQVTLTNLVGLNDGTLTLSVTLTDAATNQGVAVTDNTIMDKTAPNTPVINSITNDTGASGTDRITNDNTVIFNGTAEANSTIGVFLGGISVGTTTANNNGDFSFDYSGTILPDSRVSITVIATDRAGNSSALSNESFATIDTTQPSPPTVVGISSDTGADATDEITNDQTLVFTGTAEVNSTVEVFINGNSIGSTAATNTGAWNFDHTASTLADGTYNITAKATDVAGNSSVQSLALPITIDTAAPTVPIITAISEDTGNSAIDRITKDNTLIFSGTAIAGTSIEFFINGISIGTTTTNGNGNWTFDHTGTTLVDGNYNITTKASDTAGNTSEASSALSITVDTQMATPTLSPANDQTDVLPNTNLVLTFAEDVFTRAGNIVVRKRNDNTVFETIDVSGSSVSISNKILTVRFSSGILTPATVYYVNIDAGAIVDIAGNQFSISNNTDWDFTTIAASTVSSVSVPPNTTYKIGDNLDFTVNMILPVSITGTATIPVTIGSTTINATQVGSVTNSGTILFRYTVLEDQMDADGIAVGTAMNLNGGTMKDQFNVNAILTLNNIGVTTAVLVDGIKPTPTISSSAVSLVNGVFSTTITYDEIVENFVLSDLTVSNGTAGNLTAVTAGKVWNVDITPTADGIVSISLAANVANDVAGNESKSSNTLSREFDGTAPIVVSINRKDGDPLITGTDNANFRIIFSEDVTGVDLTDFEIALTGSATGTLNTIIAVDAKTYDMNVNGIGGQGTIGINAKDDDTIKDAATNPLGATFTGQVYTTNFIPTDIGLSATSIDENNGLTATVATISTTDADAGNSHSYALVTGTGDTDNSSFIVDGASIKTNAVSFDFETNNSYSIRLKTDDGNGGVFEKAFTITVNDVNEVPLSLDLSNNSIDEDDNAQDIGALTALDPDAGDTFSFSLTSGTGDDHNGQFAINGTTLRTAGLINFEDGATRSILVRVTDSGGNTLDKQFTINIGEVEIEPIREYNTNSPGAEVKNVFSPNGDGVNETWVIEDILDNPINEVKVYAQGGKLIFSKTNYQNDWDATFKGDPIPDGTYYYEINIYNGQKIIKGFLTIIRNK